MNLTDRQKEVLKNLSNGCDQFQAAGIMGITFRGVADHMTKIRKKLNAKTTTEAVAIAIRRGLI